MHDKLKKIPQHGISLEEAGVNFRSRDLVCLWAESVSTEMAEIHHH